MLFRSDVRVFGEAALLGSRRGSGGLPNQLPAGKLLAQGAVLVAEIVRTEAGTLAILGLMVPRHAFPPGAENFDNPFLRADADGFIDTGYPCRLDPEAMTFQVTGPPPGIVSVGGYRFVQSSLEGQVKQVSDNAAIAALRAALIGNRLAGVAVDAVGVRSDLIELGANPLIADAFLDRHAPKAA